MAIIRRIALACLLVHLLTAPVLMAQAPAIRWQRHSWGEEGVYGAAVSPDGRWLALGFADAVVRVASTEDPEEFRLLPTTIPIGGGRIVAALAFSPTGDSLVTAEMVGGAYLWDLRADTLIRQIVESVPQGIPSLAFDGRTVTIAGEYQVDRIDIDDGDTTHLPLGGVISPGGRYLFATVRDSSDRSVAAIFDLHRSASQRVLAHVAGYVHGVGFSHDETTVAYAVNEDRVLVHDVMTGARLDSVDAAGVIGIGLSADGDSLLARLGGHVMVRDRTVGAGELIALGHSGHGIEPASIGFVPGRSRVWIAEAHREGAPYAVAIPTVTVIDLPSRLIVGQITGWLLGRTARITSDGLEVVATNGGSTSRWTLDRGNLVKQPESRIDRLSDLSIDGEYASVLRWHSESSVTQSLSYEATRRDVANGTIHGYVTNYRNGLAAPGGRFHLGDGRAWNALWDVQTRSSTVLTELEGATQFSYDGTMLAASRNDRSLVIYAAPARSVMSRIANVDPARRIVFSRDGRLIAAYSADGDIQIIDVESGSAGRIIATADTSMSDHVFDRRGRFLLTASADGTVSIWDLHGDTRIDRFEVGAAVRSVDVSPDGRSIATVDGNGTLTVWEARGPIAAAESMCAPSTPQSALEVVRIDESGICVRASIEVTGEVALSLVDVSGRTVHTEAVVVRQTGAVDVLLPALRPGWYFVRLDTPGAVTVTHSIAVH